MEILFPIISIIAVVLTAIMAYMVGSHGKREIAANYQRQLDAQRDSYEKQLGAQRDSYEKQFTTQRDIFEKQIADLKT